MTLEIKILPSILAANMGRLEAEGTRALTAGADGLHIDIMDGHFVRNLSMGPDVVKMARAMTQSLLNVHLMVTHPQHFVDVFAQAGADTILIHLEAQCDVCAVLEQIRGEGARAGVVLNPETPASAMSILADAVPDEILCMTVHPGFGGQSFIKQVLPKMHELRKAYPDVDISVDGGINRETATLAAEQGANIFLMGTSLFRAADMKQSIEDVRQDVTAALQRAIA